MEFIDRVLRTIKKNDALKRFDENPQWLTNKFIINYRPYFDGCYPNEIVILSYVDNHFIDSDWRWAERYSATKNIDNEFKLLLKNGYIRVGTPEESMVKYLNTELKEIADRYGVKATRKADYIKKLAACSGVNLEGEISRRVYKLTDKGKTVLENSFQLLDFYSFLPNTELRVKQLWDFSEWIIENPNQDCIDKYVEVMSSESLDKISSMLFDRGRFSDAIEVCAIGIKNAISQPCECYFGFDNAIHICERIKEDYEKILRVGLISACQEKLVIDDNELREVLNGVFSRVKRQCALTDDVLCELVVLYKQENTEAAEKLIKNNISRLSEEKSQKEALEQERVSQITEEEKREIEAVLNKSQKAYFERMYKAAYDENKLRRIILSEELLADRGALLAICAIKHDSNKLNSITSIMRNINTEEWQRHKNNHKMGIGYQHICGISHAFYNVEDYSKNQGISDEQKAISFELLLSMLEGVREFCPDEVEDRIYYNRLEYCLTDELKNAFLLDVSERLKFLKDAGEVNLNSRAKKTEEVRKKHREQCHWLSRYCSFIKKFKDEALLEDFKNTVPKGFWEHHLD